MEHNHPDKDNHDSQSPSLFHSKSRAACLGLWSLVSWSNCSVINQTSSGEADSSSTDSEACLHTEKTRLRILPQDPPWIRALGAPGAGVPGSLCAISTCYVGTANNLNQMHHHGVTSILYIPHSIEVLNIMDSSRALTSTPRVRLRGEHPYPKCPEGFQVTRVQFNIKRYYPRRWPLLGHVPSTSARPKPFQTTMIQSSRPCLGKCLPSGL